VAGFAWKGGASFKAFWPLAHAGLAPAAIVSIVHGAALGPSTAHPARAADPAGPVAPADAQSA